MNFLWDNGLARVIKDDGKRCGEILSSDHVLIGDDGSYLRKSDLNGGRLCRIWGKVGIVDDTRGRRYCGLVPMVFVKFGTLESVDSWVPYSMVNIVE